MKCLNCGTEYIGHDHGECTFEMICVECGQSHARPYVPCPVCTHVNSTRVPEGSKS